MVMMVMLPLLLLVVLLLLLNSTRVSGKTKAAESVSLAKEVVSLGAACSWRGASSV
jgi:hypothetical protein